MATFMIADILQTTSSDDHCRKCRQYRDDDEEKDDESTSLNDSTSPPRCHHHPMSAAVTTSSTAAALLPRRRLVQIMQHESRRLNPAATHQHSQSVDVPVSPHHARRQSPVAAAAAVPPASPVPRLGSNSDNDDDQRRHFRAAVIGNCRPPLLPAAASRSADDDFVVDCISCDSSIDGKLTAQQHQQQHDAVDMSSKTSDCSSFIHHEDQTNNQTDVATTMNNWVLLSALHKALFRPAADLYSGIALRT